MQRFKANEHLTVNNSINQLKIKISMTEFQQNTETLRGQLEKGDIAKICGNAGCVPNTLYSAWGKAEATELTKAEKGAYNAFVAFVNDRIREKEQLNQRAAKVAEKLNK